MDKFFCYYLVLAGHIPLISFFSELNTPKYATL